MMLLEVRTIGGRPGGVGCSVAAKVRRRTRDDHHVSLAKTILLSN